MDDFLQRRAPRTERTLGPWLEFQSGPRIGKRGLALKDAVGERIGDGIEIQKPFQMRTFFPELFWADRLFPRFMGVEHVGRRDLSGQCASCFGDVEQNFAYVVNCPVTELMAMDVCSGDQIG
ncbi:hypothetical protein CKO28_15915 [Rhodovibrio sodomensis]|uniref:Uncharacterized protein n=1 Tax=Rhodovibrio sodomensis TaxID=1088 RepID=A0ABS1DGC7_9PROT|nr:hypothetical protein [Rhodovibrio sodomensis]